MKEKKIDSNIKLAIVIAANHAMEYKNLKPNSCTEEIIQHVMKEIKAKGKAKLAAIAAATHVINYKEKNPKAKDKEVMQFVLNKSKEICNSIKRA